MHRERHWPVPFDPIGIATPTGPADFLRCKMTLMVDAVEKGLVIFGEQ
jgi:hypothetical protein